MCGILGLINLEVSKKEVVSIFKRQLYRGRDAFGFYDGKATFTTNSLDEFYEVIEPSSILFIQNLHAVNSFVPQPLETEKSLFLWNGEIYNWKELTERYKLNVKNDSELFHKLLDSKGLEILKELNGDYAVAYFLKKEKKLILFRDLIGIKPLFYLRNENSLIFSSDKSVISRDNERDKDEKNDIMEELDPRKILVYDVETDILNFEERNFYLESNTLQNKNFIIKNLRSLLYEAIKLRAKNLDNIYVLFSGGIDSSLICYILSKLGYNPMCITAGTENSKDVEFAKQVADYYKFNHKVVLFTKKEVEESINIVKQIIRSDNYIKLSVALPFFLALKAVKDEGKVVFSGLGSEEIFAGYQRFEKVSLEDVNKECIKGLLTIHERDLYRDDIVAMWNGFELRLPFLDKNLIEFALHIDGKYKIDEKNKKIILSEVAKEIGYKDEFAERKKLAAQYGSGVDKILQKISKEKGVRKREL